MADKLLTPQELADYIGSTPSALANWRYIGRGPKFIKIGSNVRYRSADVEEWLAAQTRQRTGEPAHA